LAKEKPISERANEVEWKIGFFFSNYACDWILKNLKNCIFGKKDKKVLP